MPLVPTFDMAAADPPDFGLEDDDLLSLDNPEEGAPTQSQEPRC